MRCPKCGSEMFFIDEPMFGGGTVSCLSGHAWWKLMFTTEDRYFRQPQYDQTPQAMRLRLRENAIANW